jgi:hypothetical protein
MTIEREEDKNGITFALISDAELYCLILANHWL